MEMGIEVGSFGIHKKPIGPTAGDFKLHSTF